MCCRLSSQIQPFFFIMKLPYKCWDQNILSGCILQSVYVCNIRWNTHTHTHTCDSQCLIVMMLPLSQLNIELSASSSISHSASLSIYASAYFVSVYKCWFDTYKSGVFVCCRSPFVLVYLDFYDNAPLVSIWFYIFLPLTAYTISSSKHAQFTRSRTHTRAHMYKYITQCAKAIRYE